jgi:hypothetical protein
MSQITGGIWTERPDFEPRVASLAQSLAARGLRLSFRMRRLILLYAALAPWVTVGCGESVEEAARIRAAGEFHCPDDRIQVASREDIDSDTVDIRACGRRARYTCPRGGRWDGRTCIREPLDASP